ncbi:hypothetical protein [Wolbachia endosymbiont of Glossina morsitans morsitans]|uniref:hypothetical protein n=1 Tax=Wolbachia endosymbiont of Glossina morsitans morsitans TaxID=1150948 RepID=UPI00056E2984|nr:hypothetical protein [Wolbachia endosymbiont of Glossina morsitans morsitans]
MYNKNWIPDWNDTEGATGMTKGGTGMTGERGTGMTKILYFFTKLHLHLDFYLNKLNAPTKRYKTSKNANTRQR